MSIAKAEIIISGYEHSFGIRSLQIHSSLGEHHTFELFAPISIDDTLSRDDINQMLGQDVQIRISDDEEQKGLFSGIIDEISFGWDQYGSLNLIIEGFSPTVLLDGGPTFRGFEEKTAKDIVNTMLAAYPQKSLPEMDVSDFDQHLPWWVQMQETDYQAILRLADHLGKIAYFDGESFRIGELGEQEEPKTLKHAESIENLNLSVNLAPLNFRVEAYNPVDDAFLSEDAENRYHGNNQWVKMAMDKSEVYPAPHVFLHQSVKETADLSLVGQKLSARQAHELVSINADSSDPSLRIGSKISIQMPEKVMLSDALEGTDIFALGGIRVHQERGRWPPKQPLVSTC
ncbi:MAG: contractile injection system protein, VgrG/Pvc8 family [Bacteroidota bacterium]